MDRAATWICVPPISLGSSYRCIQQDELKYAQNNSKDYQADAIDAPELHVDWMWAERRKAKGLFRSINSCSMADASNSVWLMVPSFVPCSQWARKLQWTNQRGERGCLFTYCCFDARNAVRL